MKEVFAYTRVSTTKQGEGVSLQEQRAAIEAYAERNQLKVIDWIEEKVTAAKTGRPAFTAMLKRLKQGEANGLIIHKIDRSARNLSDWVELTESGADVHIANDGLDLSTRGGRLSADLQAVIASDYIRNLREESIKGLYGRLNQGLYPFRAPTGYRDEGKGKPKSIDQTVGPLVKELFETYASKQFGLIALGEYMARKGLVAKNGKPMSEKTLSKILNNPFYYGLIKVKSNGKTYPGIHEPIINRALFERCQEILHNPQGS